MEKDKIKRRIRRFLSTGKEQSRLYFTDGGKGIYKKTHYSKHVPFRVDRLGRIYLEGE